MTAHEIAISTSVPRRARRPMDVLTKALGVLASLVLLFIYLPMIVVVVYSFNPESVNSFPMKGFSLEWYSAVFHNESLMKALRVSLLIAIGGTAIGLLLGIPGAIAIARHEFPGKRLLERIVLLPLTLPGIVTGVAMLSLLPKVGIELSLQAVLVGHGTFLIAITLTQVYARLKRLDLSLEEASADLGATPMITFFRVILPNIQTAIIGSALLSFTLSLDEIPVTFFLIAGDSTLPIEIWTMMRNGISPEVNAMAALIFTASILLLLLSVALQRSDEEPVR